MKFWVLLVLATFLGAAFASPLKCVYDEGAELQMTVHLIGEAERLSEYPVESKFAHFPVVYGNLTAIISQPWTIDASEALRENGSLFLHVCLWPMEMSTEGCGMAETSNFKVIHKVFPWNFFEQTIREGVEKTLNLYHPMVTLNLVAEQQLWTPLLQARRQIEHDDSGHYYRPRLVKNDFWELAREFVEINESTTQLALHLNFHHITPLQLGGYDYQMTDSWRSLFGFPNVSRMDPDMDRVKDILRQMNPTVLVVGFLGSGVHILLDLAAISYHLRRNKKSQPDSPYPHIPFRHPGYALFQSTIVCAYVFIYSSNILGRLSVFLGLVWQFRRFLGENSTIRHTSFRKSIPSNETGPLNPNYPRWCALILSTSFTGRALTHIFQIGFRNYSGELIADVYGAMLTFDLLMMIPPLFLNRKLATVAYVPITQLGHRIVYTFVDDVFAWSTNMPILFLVMCLRDDLIFMVELGQMCYYPLDPDRKNDNGICLTDVRNAIREEVRQELEKSNIKPDELYEVGIDPGK